MSAPSLASLRSRIMGRWQRTCSYGLARRPFVLRNSFPLISFTFDDFPRSALEVGGPILRDSGIAGTYYASFGLIGKRAPTGQLFGREDLPTLFEQGHELGCHTHDHCHAFDTPPGDFEKSIRANRRALETLAEGLEFQTHSYPISVPSPGTKRVCARYFAACRTGGQTFNVGRVDLNALNAFFLEQSRDNLPAILELIDRVVQARGWLIFATHDIADEPTRFGVTPALFERVVRHASRSGASVLPVARALAAAGPPLSERTQRAGTPGEFAAGSTAMPRRPGALSASAASCRLQNSHSA